MSAAADVLPTPDLLEFHWLEIGPGSFGRGVIARRWPGQALTGAAVPETAFRAGLGHTRRYFRETDMLVRSIPDEALS